MKAGGRDLLVVPQKSGMAYALDPDKQGATVWQFRFGQGSGRGGQWGGATDGRQAYFGVNGNGPAAGGIVAVDLATGERAWQPAGGAAAVRRTRPRLQRRAGSRRHRHSRRGAVRIAGRRLARVRGRRRQAPVAVRHEP